MEIASIFVILAGIFLFAAAAFDWGWLMNGRRAQATSRILGGRNRTRILYMVIGAAMIILGILDGLNIIS